MFVGICYFLILMYQNFQNKAIIFVRKLQILSLLKKRFNRVPQKNAHDTCFLSYFWIEIGTLLLK